jgi:hypothetical protein
MISIPNPQKDWQSFCPPKGGNSIFAKNWLIFGLKVGVFHKKIWKMWLKNT